VREDHVGARDLAAAADELAEEAPVVGDDLQVEAEPAGRDFEPHPRAVPFAAAAALTVDIEATGAVAPADAEAGAGVETASPEDAEIDVPMAAKSEEPVALVEETGNDLQVEPVSAASDLEPACPSEIIAASAPPGLQHLDEKSGGDEPVMAAMSPEEPLPEEFGTDEVVGLPVATEPEPPATTLLEIASEEEENFASEPALGADEMVAAEYILCLREAGGKELEEQTTPLSQEKNLGEGIQTQPIANTSSTPAELVQIAVVEEKPIARVEQIAIAVEDAPAAAAASTGKGPKHHARGQWLAVGGAALLALVIGLTALHEEEPEAPPTAPAARTEPSSTIPPPPVAVESPKKLEPKVEPKPPVPVVARKPAPPAATAPGSIQRPSPPKPAGKVSKRGATTSNVHLRSGPGMQNQAAGVVGPGTKGVILDTAKAPNGTDWYQLRLENGPLAGKVVWVNHKFFSITSK